jgi:hypothetical protein
VIVRGPLTEDKLRSKLQELGWLAANVAVKVASGRAELVANRICSSPNSPEDVRCQVWVEPSWDPHEPKWEMTYV